MMMRGGEIAAGGLRGEEFAELIAVLIEYRLGAAEVVSHGHDLAADVGGVLVHIGIGHDQRLLDHGAGARREETVEPAIERRRCHDGDEDGRHRGDDGEQADDLDVQARAGAPAPARLDDDPDFAPDDGEQQKSGDGIAEQQLTTTSWTGAIGVRPASTRKVAVADSSATPTRNRPDQPDDIGIGAKSSRTSVTMLPISNKIMIAASIAAAGVAAFATAPGASDRTQWRAVPSASTGAIGVMPTSTTSVSTAEKSARMSAAKRRAWWNDRRIERGDRHRCGGRPRERGDLIDSRHILPGALPTD